MAVLKSPINWFGGKYYMANKIIEIFPEHKVFVEVFGGSGQLTFSKQPSEIEIYNDIDSGLVSFFSILRDDIKSKKLIDKIHLTPFSREEFYNCRDTWRQETDEIEKVRKWYVTVMQSFSTSMQSWKPTKSKSRRGMAQSVSQWLGHIENNLPLAVERMKMLQVENVDFKELLKKYDSPDTLFYLDPPYIHETRKMTYTYEHELENERHTELVKILLNLKGKCILSGYDHEIYNELIEHGWKKVNLGEFAKRSIKTIDEEKEKGKEFVWINY
ncbi:DNA adenine methylase [Neobacillus sp. YIM B02564]|uniref:DNA adenine methylase n=1 Tax=Neobacillus paridis TaxID=2803862 RepID=A0ABS1TIA9_9BACI|nr:DNA adenine methylase [Neobacillus paridis]MBL4951050.1 DNA adenine methylase [Neobacillus paridis]